MTARQKAQAEWFLAEAKRWRKAAVDWDWAAFHSNDNGRASRFLQRALHCERQARHCEAAAEAMGLGPELAQQRALRAAIRAERT